MCDRCHDEDDDEYDGDSIVAKRRKAIRSVIRRHPELGLEPEDVTLRFAPEAETFCIRVNVGAGGSSSTYEIHAPSSMGRAMSSSPPLRGIAMAAWIESDLSYEDVCNVLEIASSETYDAFFLGDSPPVDPVRSDAAAGVREFEREIAENV